MPQSKVVIVYSPGQALRRTVIIPDDDSQVPIHTANLQPGEAVVVVSLGLYLTIGPDACLEQILGRPRQSDRHAIVDGGGFVVALLCMDLAIDRSMVGLAYADPGGVTSVGDGVHTAGLLA